MSPLRHVSLGIAVAMLSGPPEAEGLARRAEEALGQAWPWLPRLARKVVKKFGDRWDQVERDEVAETIAVDRDFVQAWQSAKRPTIRRYWLLSPVQRPAPFSTRGELPILPTLGALADWLRLDPLDLAWFADRWRLPPGAAENPAHHYRYRLIEKTDGSYRILEAPKRLLRDIQRKILHGLLDRVPAHDAAHGFVTGRNCRSYASAHVGQPVVIRLDLRDFFPSVPAGRVHGLLRTLGYPVGVARALTAICTNRVPEDWFRAPGQRHRLGWTERSCYRDRHLPQGAPTSPALANLCAYRLDLRLAGLAQSLGARYTRYADDLAFSGGEALARVAERFAIKVAAIALEEGFAVNPRKTRVMRPGTRQHLAGVVVNRHPNVARNEYDLLKATLHNCIRYGPATQNRDGHADFRAHLRGKVAHVCALNPQRGAKLKAIFERIDWDWQNSEQPPSFK